MPVTYEPIATTTAGSNVTDVTFSSISGSYTDLILVIAGTSTNTDYTVGLRFNGDTNTNYSAQWMNSSSTSATADRQNNGDSVYSGSIDNAQSNSIISIQNYSNTTTYKTILGRGNADNSRVRAYVGMWRSTSAINSITFTTNGTQFATGCIFTLYGILKA